MAVVYGRGPRLLLRPGPRGALTQISSWPALIVRGPTLNALRLPSELLGTVRAFVRATMAQSAALVNS